MINNLVRRLFSPFFGSISLQHLVGQYFVSKFVFSEQVPNAAVWQTWSRSPCTSISETVSRREHRLQTCKFAEGKKLARPAGIICSWNGESIKLTAARWNPQAFVVPSVLVALCPTKKFKSSRMWRDKKKYISRTVLLHVSLAQGNTLL